MMIKPSLFFGVVFCAAVSGAGIAQAEAPSILGCVPVRNRVFWVIDDSIPDGTGTPLTVSIPVLADMAHPEYSNPILDVDLSLDSNHSQPRDLDITLTSPAGTIVTLSTDNGTTNAGVFSAVNFDDQALEEIVNYPYASGVSARNLNPEEPLSQLAGESPIGTWTLSVSDDTTGGGTGGVLDGVLYITTCSAAYGYSAESTFSASPAAAIPDNQSGPAVESNITVSGMTGTLCHLEVETNITHTFSADIEAFLRAPTGREITLVRDVGSGYNDIFGATRFRDNAGGAALTDRVFAANGPVSPLPPQQALASFYGIDPNGAWRLLVRDDLASDTGTVNSWSLILKTCSADSDADGSGDFFDGCPSDSAKTAPGICGCGSADTDSNANGIADCLTTNELAAKIAAAKLILSGVSLPLTPAEKALINQYVAAVNALASYANSAKPAIHLKSGQKLSALLGAAKTGAKTLKGAFSVANRKAALGALTSLQKALVIS